MRFPFIILESETESHIPDFENDNWPYKSFAKDKHRKVDHLKIVLIRLSSSALMDALLLIWRQNQEPPAIT